MVTGSALAAPLIIASALLWSAVMEVLRDPPESERVSLGSEAWEEGLWTLLHASALAVPREYGYAAREFESLLRSLPSTLPSAGHRRAMHRAIEAIPPRPFLRKGRAGAVAVTHLYRKLVSADGAPSLLEPEEAILRRGADGVTAQALLALVRSDVDERGLQAMMAAATRVWELEVPK